MKEGRSVKNQGLKHGETPLLELIDVRKAYKIDEVPVTALRGLSLKVARGDFVTIIGPSGSGKTTLLNVIGLLDRPDEGRVFMDGVNVSRLDQAKLGEIRLRKIGFIFQTFQLIPWLSAVDNVEVPLIIAGEDGLRRRRRAVELLNLVGLSGRLKHRPSQLSGGEQQRVAIARALANRPEMVLADEPTGNLDSKTGWEIVQLLKRLNSEGKTTLIVVTHNPDLTQIAKRTLHIKDGMIVKEELH